MSLLLLWVGPRVLSFPRVSGDEPLKGKAIVSFDSFSPRERG